MNQKLKILADGTKEVLQYLKSKYQFIHLSNVFFRDLQYGLISYFEAKGMKLGYGESEVVTRRFIEILERSGILKPIKTGSWMLNYPEFKKPPVKPAAPAKPAASAAPRPATGSAAKQQAAGAPMSLPAQAEASNSNSEQPNS
ncbi:MAG: hypothetical protein AABZ02_10455 [Bacteroidota bacterium]